MPSQDDWNLIGGWDVYREERFCIYLICDMASILEYRQFDDSVGYYLAFYLMQAKSLRAILHYFTRISALPLLIELRY